MAEKTGPGLRQEHCAGEKVFVDYAGATIPIHDPQSGDVHAAAVFVAVLGPSSYTFAEAAQSTGAGAEHGAKGSITRRAGRVS